MAEASPRRRWYHLSPDRLIIGLFAVEGFLFLSEQFQWFAFNEKKGWTVLIAVAAVCLVVVVMLLWLVVSLLFRCRFQFSLRSLVVLVVAVAIPCCWLPMKMREAERQRTAVEAILKAGGGYYCDFEFDESGMLTGKKEPEGPSWLRELVGVHFLAGIVVVDLYDTEFGDAEMAHLSTLTRLERLELTHTRVTDDGIEDLMGLTKLKHLKLCYTELSDTGLENLKGLAKLERLEVKGTQVTEEGISELRNAFPDCEIIWDGETTQPPTN